MKCKVSFYKNKKFEMLREVQQIKASSKNIAEMECNRILSHLCDQYNYTIRGEFNHSNYYLNKLSSQEFHMEIMRKLLYRTKDISAFRNVLAVLLKYQEFRLSKTEEKIRKLYEEKIKGYIFYDAIARKFSDIFRRLFGWIRMPAIFKRLFEKIRTSLFCERYLKASSYGELKSISDFYTLD